MSRDRRMVQGQRLSTLLAGLAEVDAANDCEIRGLAIDSRDVVAGDLFLAYRGANTDGLDYLKEAIEAGAVAAVYEDGEIEAQVLDRLAIVRVENLQQQLGLIASRFYANPSQQLFVVGVTGTNGKTSCCHFLSQALKLHGDRCGVIGTLGYGLADALQPATHTTPNPVVLQACLREMVDAGATQVVMEVSSHALVQARVAAVAFDVAVFTNLTRDHLDYHNDMAAYGAAKQKLFEMPGLSYAVINQNDSFGEQLLTALPVGVKAVAYGLCHDEYNALASDQLEVYGRITRMDEAGIEMAVVSSWGEGVLRSDHLLGEFNAQNLLAVLAVLLLMEIPLAEALSLLAQVRNADGRMARLGGNGVQPLVVIDYAHTSDALQNVLTALRRHCRGNLWCVFGCGGERDRGKRPLMGQVAEQLADSVIITDDNPRNEDASMIVDDIVSAVSQRDKIQVIHDREMAIRTALSSAKPDDVVLIAGKGHEAYQLVSQQKIPFSDRQCVEMILQEVA